MTIMKAFNMNIKDPVQSDINRSLVSDRSLVKPGPIKTTQTSAGIANSHSLKASNATQLDISPIWQQAAQKIDLRNASTDDVAALSASLFKANAISFEDHVNLSFQVNSDDQKPKDFIEYWQTRQDQALVQGASREDINDIVRIQSILNYVDSLKE